VSDVLGVSKEEAEKIQLSVIDSFITYLNASRQGDNEKLSDPAFIASTISIMLRGSYLRESVDTDTAKRLEQDVQAFEKEFGLKAAEAIRTGQDTLENKLSTGASVTVSPGGVVVIENEGDKLTAVYSVRP
jgi:hypothetical protein